MSYFAYALRTLAGLILRRPILGTCVIPVMDDGSIVLVLRRDNRRWSLPGGIVDWGEDIMTSATRELKEENRAGGQPPRATGRALLQPQARSPVSFGLCRYCGVRRGYPLCRRLSRNS